MSKLDKFRTNLFHKDYQSLRTKINGRNPFLSVNGISSVDAEFLMDFFKLPNRQSYLQSRRELNDKGKRKKKNAHPKVMIFIVDALEKLVSSHKLLNEKTQIGTSGWIHADFDRLKQLSVVALNHFKELSNTHPTLSIKHYLKELRSSKKFSQDENLDGQIKSALHGLHTKHPVYVCFLQPFVESPTQKKQESLVRHQIINAVVWNAYLYDRYRLSSHVTVQLALRGLDEAFLKQIKGLLEINSHRDLITLLKKIDNNYAKDIVRFLNKLNRPLLSPAKNPSDQSKTHRSHSPHVSNYWIETDQNLTIHDFGELEDGLVILQKLTSKESELNEDLADDELVEQEFLQELPGEETALPEAKVVNLANKLKHLANFNQFLKEELTPTEVDAILDYSLKTSQKKSTSESELRALMLINISFATGYNLHQKHSLRWLQINPEPNRTIPCISEDCKTLFLPIPHYEYLKKLNAENQYLYYRASNVIEIPLPTKISQILQQCLTGYYLKKSESEDAVSNSTKQQSLQKTIKVTLKKIGLDARVTLSLIQNNMPYTALKYANGDLWTISLFSGREDIMSSTHKHYTTIDVRRALAIYQKSIFDIFGEKIKIPSAKNVKKFEGIGNPFRPQKHYVVEWLNQVAEASAKWVAQAPKNLDTTDLIHCINLLNGFFDTYLSFFIASRNTTNPYIYQQQRLSNGFVTLNDKNRNEGYNTHFVYLPTKLQKLQIEFEAWVWQAFRVLTNRKYIKIEDLFSEKLGTIHKWKSLDASQYRFPGFLLLDCKMVPTIKKTGLKPKIKLVPYTRGNLHSLLTNQVPELAPPMSIFEKNIGRHFLRSSLLEREVNPEYIDEYMGHRHYGTETWNRSSLFNPSDYMQTMKKALELIMKDFKVNSPFQEKS